MAGEPGNAAAEFQRWGIAQMNDREFFVNELSSFLTPDFVRLDRRPMIAQPPADGDEYLASHLALEELGGCWPTYTLVETIAVRGERLVAGRTRISVGSLGDLEQIVIARMDDTIDRLELILLYDPDDLDDALAELDRLHAEIID